MNPDPLAGKVFGGFRILSLLTKGGYGRVYEAEQLALRRRAALKVVDAKALNTPVKRKRFLREAQLLARFAHPNIVQVFETGQQGDTFYLAMEFVEGTSLAERIERKELLSPREAVHVATSALSALARAHKEGVIHRDVKPGNLLLTNEGNVKLADFGLAKDLGSPALTEAGVILGTPLYMSPEQAHGQKVDARWDVFSLGATLYHAVTGRPPMSDRDLARKTPIATEAPPKVGEVAPLVPLELAEWIDRAMAREGAQGFASAEQAQEELAKVPLPAPPVAQRWTPWVSAAIAAAAFLLVVGLLYPMLRRKPPAPPPPSPPAVQVREEEARGISDTGKRRVAWQAILRDFPKERRACAEGLFEIASIDEQGNHFLSARRNFERLLQQYSDEEEVCRRARQRLLVLLDRK